MCYIYFNRFQVRCDYISVSARRTAVLELIFNYTAQMALKMRAYSALPPQFAYYAFESWKNNSNVSHEQPVIIIRRNVYVLFGRGRLNVLSKAFSLTPHAAPKV